MISKAYRLEEFFNPIDECSLIVDTSAGLSKGPVKGLESFKTSVIPILPVVDGVVTSPGQSRVFSGRTRKDAALLIRADWTNALRNEDFVLPPEKIHHVTLLDSTRVLDLGGSAIVLYFLLGHEENIEADCLKRSVQMAIQCSQTGLPLILDVQPIGERVVLRSKAIELGVSYALEAGADGAAIPWPGEESLELIIKMAAEMPVWVKPSDILKDMSILSNALDLGARGIWLDETIFSQKETFETLLSIAQTIHPDILIREQGEGA
jgi:DhnA family fructose-bisphosphate aldolase class Ia